MTASGAEVSVIIPAYNAAAHIGEALSSVFTQTFTNFEVIVVDDGSTDGTSAVVEAWGERVTLIRQENAGPGKARNVGLAATRAPLVAFLDADDVWLPGKLAAQVAYFRTYPETGLLHTAIVTSGDERARAPRLADPQAPMAPPRGMFCEIFHTDLDVNTLTVMIRRDVLREAGTFDERREIHVEDWDLWLRIAARYPVGYLPQVTAIRRPGGIMSREIAKTFNGQAAVVRKLLPLCREACPMSGREERRCLRRRWYRLYWEFGYAMLRAGDRPGARRAFVRAITHNPFAPGGYVRLATTFLRQRALTAARSARRRLPRSRPRGDRSHRPAADGASPRPRTAYNRVRGGVVSRLHDLDDAVYRARSGERRRILFDAASPMSFAIFRPVYERLAAESEPRLLVHGHRVRLGSRAGVRSVRHHPAHRSLRQGGVDEGGCLRQHRLLGHDLGAAQDAADPPVPRGCGKIRPRRARRSRAGGGHLRPPHVPQRGPPPSLRRRGPAGRRERGRLARRVPEARLPGQRLARPREHPARARSRPRANDRDLRTDLVSLLVVEPVRRSPDPAARRLRLQRHRQAPRSLVRPRAAGLGRRELGGAAGRVPRERRRSRRHRRGCDARTWPPPTR